MVVRMSTVNDPTADDFHIQVSSRDSNELATALAAWLPTVIASQAPPVVTAAGASDANGMSSETIAVQASWPGDDLPDARWILRMAPAAQDVPVFRQYRLDHQYEVMRLVGELTDVPVPTVVALEPTGDILGEPFFLMEECAGVVPPDVLPYTCGGNWLADAPVEQQRALQDATVRVIAGIHSVPAGTCEFLNETMPQGDSDLRRQFAWLVDWYEFAAGDIGRSGLIDRAIEWLESNFPEDVAASESVVTWGDARIGNIMYEDFVPAAVLDWEMATRAPRELDVAWGIALHRFFQFVTGVKGHHIACLDGNGLAGARVASRAGGAILDRKRAEATQFHAIAGCQRVGDLVQDCIYDIFDIPVIEMRITGRDDLHQFRLYHADPLNFLM